MPLRRPDEQVGLGTMRSNWRSVWVTEGCEISSSCAAAVSVPCRSIATSVRSCRFVTFAPMLSRSNDGTHRGRSTPVRYESIARRRAVYARPGWRRPSSELWPLWGMRKELEAERLLQLMNCACHRRLRHMHQRCGSVYRAALLDCHQRTQLLHVRIEFERATAAIARAWHSGARAARPALFAHDSTPKKKFSRIR